MKKFLICFLGLILIIGCSKKDERGFYTDGKYVGLHEKTNEIYDLEGFDIKGYNKLGYNSEGFDIKGYDKNGYDKNNFDKEGWNRGGVHKSKEDPDYSSEEFKYYSGLKYSLKLVSGENFFREIFDIKVPYLFPRKDDFESTQNYNLRKDEYDKKYKKEVDEKKRLVWDKFYMISYSEKLKYDADMEGWKIDIRTPYSYYDSGRSSSSSSSYYPTLIDTTKARIQRQLNSFGTIRSYSTERKLNISYFKDKNLGQLVFPMQRDVARNYDISNLRTYVIFKPIISKTGSADNSTIIEAIGVHAFIYNIVTKEVVFEKLLLKSKGYSSIDKLGDYDIFGYNKNEKEENKKNPILPTGYSQPQVQETGKTSQTTNVQEENEYIVLEKTHFHNSPSASTVRKGYLIKGDKFTVSKYENGYGYTEFLKTKGWILLDSKVTKK